ncbi:hypothetical protein [Fodinibius halophilus]|uniref:Alpha/beta hydrolase n=1 Tax=Fodinibius halophilus TaxID=1736908 RepID=A0A6M1T929_9BACT|nr:hypothetical protein [Fodinibius halophilus]NGP89073.1 hypothetical protein [Fodinibius halophilus]
MTHRFIIIFFLSLLFAGCANKPRRVLHEPEKRLGTHGKTPMLFHSALYYPSGISLNFPGYILGIEKSDKKKITDNDDLKITGLPETGLPQRKAANEIVDKKIMYVSHIVRYYGKKFGRDNCALYNAYIQPNNIETTQSIPLCDGVGRTPIPPKQAYIKSWYALDQLKKILKQDISARQNTAGEYTHIVVTVMGWNTVQEKAVRNFNSIIKNIKQHAGERFNPLFIGVTWPSEWVSSWIKPLFVGASFPTKKLDSDEIGLTWLGVFIHDIIPEVNDDLPITLIGHSFGARALSVATCAGPAIYRTDSPIKKRTFDDLSLINLQGAFSINRFLGEINNQKITFNKRCTNIPRVFLTSSKYDNAVDKAFWSDYTGSIDSYNQFCKDYKKNGSANCLKTDSLGNIETVYNNDSHIFLIQADKLINRNAYLTKGGAHSDIYRKEHGNFLWNLITGKYD